MRIASFLLTPLMLSVLLLAVSPAVLGQTFSTLEERMSATQFQAAGLDKLSPEELATLNAWLQEHVAGTSAVSATQPAPASFDSSGEDRVVSRVIGEFNGWEGKTEFRLENGQVWRQTEDRAWHGVHLVNPKVTIRQGMLGSWILKVDGYNTTTRVKRIR